MSHVCFLPIKLAGLELSNRIVVCADVPVQRRRRLRHRLAHEPSRHAGEFRRRPRGGRGDPRRAPRPHHPWLRRALFRRQRGGDGARHRPSAGASAPPSSASSSRMPAARLRRSGRGRAAGRSSPARTRGRRSRRRRSRSATAGTCRARRRWTTSRGCARPSSMRRSARCASASTLIELHYAHGYLAHSFLSPISNKRTDQYGGSLENRMRFGREIAQAVRAVVPKSIALGARITGSDWRDDGITADDAVAYAKALEGRRPRLHRRVVRRHHRRHPQSDRARLQRADRRDASSARPASRPAWSA